MPKNSASKSATSDNSPAAFTYDGSPTRSGVSPAASSSVSVSLVMQSRPARRFCQNPAGSRLPGNRAAKPMTAIGSNSSVIYRPSDELPARLSAPAGPIVASAPIVRQRGGS